MKAFAVALVLAALCVPWLGCGSQSAEKQAADIVLQKGGFSVHLEEFAKSKTPEQLIEILKSKDSKARVTAINALGYHKGSEAASKALADVTDNSKSESNDIYFALLSLARLGAPQARPAIEKAMKGSNAYVREAAVQAIGVLGDRSLYPLALGAANDPNPGVSRNAQYVIERYELDKAQ